MREAPSIAVLIANMPIDGNSMADGNYGSCAPASFAHLLWLVLGKVIPRATVIKDYMNWCPGNNGCTTGLLVWKIWWNGMNGQRFKQFCRIGSQKDFQWAIDKKKGCSARIFNGAHQATFAGNVGDEQHYRVVVWPTTDDIREVTWPQITSSDNNDPNSLALDTGGHFAISETYDAYMLWLSLKNNWKGWGFVLLCLAALVYIGLRIGGIA